MGKADVQTTIICSNNGRELIVHAPKRAFSDTLDKGNDIEGNPLVEALPELKGQGFDKYAKTTIYFPARSL